MTNSLSNYGDRPPDFTKRYSASPVCLLLRNCSMQQTRGSTLPVRDENRDIIFACEHCSTLFVVDSAAAGITLDCRKCGKPTRVPNPDLEAAADDSIRVSDLQRQLKENESQRVEITGYINQLSIQLHRWQLRLQTLKERQQKLQTELAAICGPIANSDRNPTTPPSGARLLG